jgi:leucyl/phenylalanyl-tRNA---protein transferase
MEYEDSNILFPEVLLLGYQNGFFPMAEESTGRVVWHRPDPRAIIPLETVHIPRSLRSVLKKNVFEVSVNAAFEEVVRRCSLRAESWISDEIIDAYTAIHHLGFAHSVETWQDSRLVGGLYGVCIGAAFFGESMFHVVPNASKVAFAHLISVLKNNGFKLLDTQYINSFTEQLGAIEIPDSVYQAVLGSALNHDCSFT